MRKITNALVGIIFLVGCATIPPEDHAQGDGICKLHNVPMQKSTVRIIRGYPDPRIIDENMASKELFPNGRDYVLGGCIVRQGQPSRAVVFMCDECVQARKLWCKNRPETTTRNRAQPTNAPYSSPAAGSNR